VTLHFADGSNARGDILVGADGLKSVVGHQIVGEISCDLYRRCRLAHYGAVTQLPKDFSNR